MGLPPKFSWRDRRREFRRRFKNIKGVYQILRVGSPNSALRDALAAVRTFLFPEKTILFYPEHPVGRSVACKLCAVLGYAISTNPHRRFDAVVKWRDATFSSVPELETSGLAGRIVNIGSVDISKERVAKTFAEVFGYSLAVNPVEFCGKIVEKSNDNARHDGRILDGPLPPESLRPGYVYQRLVDNSTGPDGLVQDYRVTFFDGMVPMVYVKHRPPETRFSDVFCDATLVSPEDVFAPSVLENMILLTKKMGLDYGELDVLQDRDGRFYVVDVNNTPHGPSLALTSAEHRRALNIMSPFFARLLSPKPA